MRNPDEFDAFYRAAQHRLLLQTYALTGDLPASRGAVRATVTSGPAGGSIGGITAFGGTSS